MDTRNINITDSYPLELHYIKALFVQRRYRQCIQACRDALKNAGERIEEQPLKQTFITFYLGLAHDELARLMHDCSQAKLSAFSQAELFYKDAMKSLPNTAADCETGRDPRLSNIEDPFTDSTCADAPAPMTPEQKVQPIDDDYDPFNYSSPSYTQSPPMSPPNYSRPHLPTRSPPAVSRETSSSDLESHSSFDQIMTPHKVLHRDMSRMSLLDEVHGRPGRLPRGLPRTVSGMSLTGRPHGLPGNAPLSRNMSEGLLRPIRPGSPPQAFHVPPRLPYVRSAASTSRLPKLMTRNLWETPSRNMPSAIAEEEHSPSPVSPLGWNDATSDVSTISPVSPETPVRYFPEPEYQDFGTEDSHTTLTTQREKSDTQYRVDEHLAAMRAQLDTQIRMLENAKARTLTAQAARAHERASTTAPTTGTPLPPVRASLDSALSNSSRPCSTSSKHDSVMGESKRMPQLRSYWLLKPEDLKVEEPRKRMEVSKERRWGRERERKQFDAAKYVQLAEKALAEL